MTRKSNRIGPADIRAALAPFGFPTEPGPGLYFDDEGRRLVDRGFPELRLLTDEEVSEKKAIKRAEKALDAIDPSLPLRIPRDVARRFLLGYEVGPLLFVSRNHPRKNAGLREQRAARIRSDDPVTLDGLRATLDRHGRGMGDTYSRWRSPKVLYLYEAFLGTEPVARALVDYLLVTARDLERWGIAGDDPYRLNASPHYHSLAFPWLARRLEPDVAAALRAELATAPAPAPYQQGQTGPQAYFALLRWLSDPGPLPEKGWISHLGLPLMVRGDDREGLKRFVAERGMPIGWGVLPQVARLCGTAGLEGKLSVSGLDVVRLMEVVSPLKDPGIVRLVATIAATRKGRQAASAWLQQHAAYARPIVEALATLDDKKDQKACAAALEALEAAEFPEWQPLTEEQLEAETAAIFERLGEALRAAGGDIELEKEAIGEAYEAYKEARTAAGNSLPGAYFTHRFGDFGVEDWAMLAVDVLSEP